MIVVRPTQSVQGRLIGREARPSSKQKNRRRAYGVSCSKTISVDTARYPVREENVSQRSLREAEMPTYEYMCLTCHKTFSQTLTLAKAGKPKVVCPHCPPPKV